MSTINIVDWINSLSESELKDQLVLTVDGQTPTKGNSADKVSLSDIVDDLNSTDVDKPLSANQGKVLQDSKEDADNTILKEGDVEDSLNSTSVTKPLSANQGKELQDNKESADNTILKEGDVENTLTSTSTTEPLSANQGKQLNDDKASLSAINNDTNFYEEGVWTPIHKGSVSGSVLGADEPYIKQGNVCTIWYRQVIDLSGELEGDVFIDGIPFVDLTDSVASLTHGSNIVYPTGATTLIVRSEIGIIRFRAYSSELSALLQGSNIVGNNGFTFSLTYKIA